MGGALMRHERVIMIIGFLVPRKGARTSSELHEHAAGPEMLVA